MPSRRGFIGGIFTGAAAIFASKVASVSAAIPDVQKEVVADEAVSFAAKSPKWKHYTFNYSDLKKSQLVEKIREAQEKFEFNQNGKYIHTTPQEWSSFGIPKHASECVLQSQISANAYMTDTGAIVTYDPPPAKHVAAEQVEYIPAPVLLKAVERYEKSSSSHTLGPLCGIFSLGEYHSGLLKPDPSPTYTMDYFPSTVKRDKCS